MCGYSLEEVEGLTNKILTGPETDTAGLDELLACVRRAEPSVQTLVNYKKGGVRFVNQVVTLPVYDEQDELAAFVSMLHELDEGAPGETSSPSSAATAPSLNPGHAHLWTALQLRFETHAACIGAEGAEDAARAEAARMLLSNHMAVLADMTAEEPSPSQPHLERVPAGVRPYADQALRETCRRLLGCSHSAGARGVVNERLDAKHPLHAVQQSAWAKAVTYLDRRIQTEPHPSGRAADMSEAAAAAMRSALRQIGREACS